MMGEWKKFRDKVRYICIRNKGVKGLMVGDREEIEVFLDVD